MTHMAAPATIDEFLDLIRKSGVLEEERLTSHLHHLSTGRKMPATTNELAARFIRDGLLTQFQARQLLLGKWRRFLLGGKYKLLEMLGSGGMGAVYLCEHVIMRRLVALKVLPGDKISSDPSMVERFHREARATAALDHPNIVRSFDVDKFDGLHALVMEFIDGSSLHEVVARHGPLSVERACHYIAQTAMGLQHAHESGLVHRDIKPGNLLLDRTGTVKILDLGLARFFDNKTDNVTEKYDERTVLGTADYLAPEQAMLSKVDIRADIYSLGATMYFLLAGRAPFQEGSVAQKLVWHQMRQPDPLTNFRRDVPRELMAVIDRMMAKDAGQRYQQPIEVAEALAPWTAAAVPPPESSEMPQLSPAVLAAGRQNDQPGAPNRPSLSLRRGNLPNRAPASAALHASAEPGRRTPLPPPLAQAGLADGSSETTALPPPGSEEEKSLLQSVTNWSGGGAPPPASEAARQRRQTTLLVAGGLLGGFAVVTIAVTAWAWTSQANAGKPIDRDAVRTKVAGSPAVPVPGGSSAAPPAVAAPPGGLIEPEAADQHIGRVCTLEFVVQSTGYTGTKALVFLNSKTSPRSKGNFTIVLPADTVKALNHTPDEARTYYQKKRVRVRGEITTYDDRPQIMVKDPSQLTVLDGDRAASQE
jgi:serine/threonine protein kinase